MASRGLWHVMSARKRRSLALSWSALFVLSLLMQYFSFAIATPSVLAVHNDGLFELDRNATTQSTHDWDQVYADDLAHTTTSGTSHIQFVTDAVNSTPDEHLFTTGGSKDPSDISSWRWTSGPGVQDKNDIEHAYAAAYVNGAGHRIVYFGQDRYAQNGDAFDGFWFLKNGVSEKADGTFNGVHADGDVLVQVNFTNGGVINTFLVSKWESGGLVSVANGVDCTDAATPVNDFVCGVVNTSEISSPWPYTPKSGTADKIPAGGFFEAGIDLSHYGLANSCFSTFVSETRSSQPLTSTLSDYAMGGFSFCEPPTIATQSSAASADFGGTVTDVATLTGNGGPASGTVKFFVCGPSASKPNCGTGGTQIGGAVDVTTNSGGGTATSDPVTVGVTAAASGWYCWRAEYTPSATALYLAAKHTDTDTECFFVAPATIEVTKTANPVGPVNAGDTIGFDITVHNNGTQTTLDPNLSDNLPGGVHWTLGTVTGGASCQISGADGSQVLSCTKASLAADASYSVHVSAVTDKTDCGTINNSAHVSSSNDGTDDASASVVVQCPDIKVTKTPDGGSVDAGGTITWSIKVENIGAGTATSVTLADNLPAGIHWTESENDCTITGPDGSQVLNCTVGTLASGASKTYQVSGVTSKANCGPVNNTAIASATNEPSNVLGNNSDDGSVTVLCATVTIGKTADASPVSAGSQIGFTLTWGNSTGGKATGVVVSDNLPGTAGLHWTIASSTGTGSTCAISGLDGSQVLTCNVGDIAGNTAVSGTVHIVSGTTSASCAVVNNTGHVTTDNDGSADANASVTVQCPDLEVVKTGNGPLSAGDTAIFTIVLTNHGPGAAANVTLSDQLPSGTWTLGGANAASCSINGSNLLTCNFGTVASGASRTITVSKASVAAECPSIHNEVTVAASNENTDTDQFSNTDDADIVVNCPDVHVLKTADSGTINAGEVAAFTIVVSNDGAGTAKNVTLHDPLPGGVNWAINPPVAGCAIVSNTLDCSFASLASGASVTIHVSGLTDNGDCAGLDNTAVVAASNEPVADQSDNSDSASIDVNCPDIGVVKTADDGTISAGDTAAFTVVITNQGPGTAFNVHVADTLPAGVTWTLDPAVAGCSIVGTALTCDFESLAPAASITLHISGETVAANCGTLHNVVTISASNETPNGQFPNSASADITVDCPAIVITKTADKATISAGDPIGFTITVTNTGLGNATAVHVSDNLPAGFTWTADAPTGTASASCSINTVPNPDVLTCDAAVMAPGSSFSVHIHGTTSAANCGVVNNQAFVTTGNDGGDDDSSSVTVQCPDVSVQKTPDGGTVNAGENAVFTIVVHNSGAEGIGTADDVTLTDNLPAGYTWTLGGADAAACSINTGPNPDVLSCNFGTMAPGASRTVTLTAPTTGDNCAVIPNVAVVAASNEAEANTGNNSDGASINVTCPDIEVVKDAPNTPIPVGEDLVYTITVTNIGDGTANDVVLKDTLPAGFDWKVDNAACDIAGGVLTCDLGNMAPDTTVTITLTAPTSGDPKTGNVDCGETLVHVIPNVASASSSNEGDNVLGNNSDGASITVLCSALSIQKSFTGNTNGTDPDLNVPSAKIGDTLHYTLHYTGAGPIVNATITDVLPVGLEYVSGSAAGDANFTFDSYDSTTRTLTWKAASGLPDPASGDVTYDVKVLATAPERPQPLVNTATIVGHTPSGAELTDSDTASVAVLAPPLELTPPPTDTLTPQTSTSNPGFALMLILLGVAGLALGVGFITPVPERVRRRERGR